MEKKLPLEEMSISDVYVKSQYVVTYKIPVYQRNYAWEEEQVTALIKDIYDSWQKNPLAPYYIGTLVTYKRNDMEYEVIDGQQRLTTIYLIIKALGIKDIKNKLTYSARSTSTSTIMRLNEDLELGDEADAGIRNGYGYAKKALETIVLSDERDGFQEYFLQQVKLIHYDVPKDVNLNHYFEVMNSRGEQLEKHEIVKSMLGQYLNKQQLATFCRIWEACSEMNVYIQQVFPDKTVFGSNLQDFCIEDFMEIPQQDEAEGKETIMNLLRNPVTKVDASNATDQNDRFQSIIDFPNFLLIVLKVSMMKIEGFDYKAFKLDDKELLIEFKKALDGKEPEQRLNFAREFAFNLLKARYLLDNYIIHHTLSDKELSGDNPWKLQYYKFENRKGYPVNLSTDDKEQEEMVHLLSMFEVAFTPKQRKNYLVYTMMYLFENYRASKEKYLGFLQRLADRYFYHVYLNADSLSERNLPKPNAFDEALLQNGVLNDKGIDWDRKDYKAVFASIYQSGSADIPLFVFNYTDYMIWKKYADTLRGRNSKKGSKERNVFFEILGCSDFELDSFNSFYFSRTRKSLEHYYPQAKAGADKQLSEEEINCFGNFAMIGAEANSSGSNWDPKTKLDHYSDGKSNPVSVASLKFQIMMQKCKDNDLAMLNGELNREHGMEWNAEDMKAHQQKMLDIIIKR